MNQKVWEKTDKTGRKKRHTRAKEKESVSRNHKIWGNYFGTFPLEFICCKTKMCVTSILKSETTKNVEKAIKNKYMQRYIIGDEELKEWSPSVSISYNWINPN